MRRSSFIARRRHSPGIAASFVRPERRAALLCALSATVFVCGQESKDPHLSQTALNVFSHTPTAGYRSSRMLGGAKAGCNIV
ncbi:hypothetical protein GGE45_001018 [Rhizobium aethiopicum]|uniref:Uncharacterized protein n=1 Tax=Rhizobium aethiopicum TaxID=1138170 RepID=A0A7W6MF34_9HYPH|nr:hypothetical protein [Rhizobium aethiopicum]MBB4191489.1 hypothetical protein [Rhizobium aethiopicum]MBB4578704.1 hypothetical protein [Rhizobium aethiopicum]